MPELPITFEIDHATSRIRMTTTGERNSTTAHLDSAQIVQLMAILSQCQHALVLSEAGTELALPIDPLIAFEPQAGTLLLGAYDTVWKATVGVDDLRGAVSLLVLSHQRRLSGYRIAVETAQLLGVSLVDTANKIQKNATRQ